MKKNMHRVETPCKVKEKVHGNVSVCQEKLKMVGVSLDAKEEEQSDFIFVALEETNTVKILMLEFKPLEL
jgi:hypothetical protein